MYRPAPANNAYYDNPAYGATFTVGTEATNAINVAVQLVDPNYRAIAERLQVSVYLSDDAHGDSLVASAPSSGWAIGTNGLLIPVVSNKAALITSESDGTFDITITESTAKDFWVVVVVNGKLFVKKVSFA